MVASRRQEAAGDWKAPLRACRRLLCEKATGHGDSKARIALVDLDDSTAQADKRTCVWSFGGDHLNCDMIATKRWSRQYRKQNHENLGDSCRLHRKHWFFVCGWPKNR